MILAVSELWSTMQIEAYYIVVGVIKKRHIEVFNREWRSIQYRSRMKQNTYGLSFALLNCEAKDTFLTLIA